MASECWLGAIFSDLAAIGQITVGLVDNVMFIKDMFAYVSKSVRAKVIAPSGSVALEKSTPRLLPDLVTGDGSQGN